MKFTILFFSLTLLINSCSSSSNIDNGDEAAPLSENEILDKVQKDALIYFWDLAHPTSKLARERYHVDNPSFDQEIVTTGGSAFGLMTIIVGIERGFVSRTEAVTRLQTALNFLENADRFHGAWPH